MLCAKQNRSGVFGALAICGALFVSSALDTALAQEPPLTIPPGGPFGADPNAISFNGWLLYPSLNTFTQYSNNYFISPQQKISGWSFGGTPSMTAEWSNGIHSTTLFGTYTHLDYPTANEVNTNNGEATITQQYAPLRDLNFTFLGDYTHLTRPARSPAPSPRRSLRLQRPYCPMEIRSCQTERLLLPAAKSWDRPAPLSAQRRCPSSIQMMRLRLPAQFRSSLVTAS